ncbi:unnamed protein product [Clonostachys solani]|uniref:Uncharacterized protein n=1 Tax=Clonostachys solani TaxID=160281 RepID=A0A9N9Z123_9HYPO|nr:unnamed protein product [Clonostachys solani]
MNSLSQEQLDQLMQQAKSFSKVTRSMYDEEVKKGIAEGMGDNSLDQTLWSAIHSATKRTANLDIPFAGLEVTLHDLWYVCIQATKNIHSSNLKQDQILRYLMSAKAMGPLRRTTPSSEPGNASTTKRGEIITFSDGHRFWSDLPFFGQDLIDEFANSYYQRKHYDESQRANFAAFIGRLLSVAIYDGPALCTLSLFQQALETPRPLVSVVGDKESGDRVLPVQDLLHALRQLAHYSQNSIVILANIPGAATDTPNVVYDGFPQMSGLGELAKQAGTITSPSGYSAERFEFWIQRLQQLSQCEVESIADDAKECLTVLEIAQDDIGPLTE